MEIIIKMISLRELLVNPTDQLKAQPSTSSQGLQLRNRNSFSMIPPLHRPTFTPQEARPDPLTQLMDIPQGPVTVYESVGAPLTGIYSAIKMLNSRIRVLHHHLLAMQKDYRKSIATSKQLFGYAYSLMSDYNDTLLIAYLTLLTNCSSTMNELVDKFNTAYDRHSRGEDELLLSESCLIHD